MASRVHDYYHSYWREGDWEQQTLPAEIRRLLEPLARHGASCLDVGSGSGQTAEPWLSERGVIYTGVDVSRAAVEEGAASGRDVRMVEDASELPFPDASFDLAICIEVLEHLFDPRAAALEIKRVVRPGGSVLVAVPNAAYWQRRAELLLGTWNPYGDPQGIEQPWRDPHLRFFTLPALMRFLESAGLEPVRAGGHYGSPVSELPLLRRIRGLRHLAGAYARIERRRPALLSQRLHALARNPG